MINLDKKSTDYDVNVRIIAFVVILIFLIFMSIYCIRIYALKKQSILHEMRIEADILESSFSTDINYSSYFLKIVARRLKHQPMNLEYIQKELQYYSKLANNPEFGWRKYSWVDINFREVVTSSGGIITEPKTIYSIEPIIEKLQQKQIMFYTSKNNYKNDSLKLITAVIENQTKQFVGYVMLSYDIATIIRRLNANKRNNYTNFIILDDKLSVVALSKASIPNLANNDGSFSNHLDDVLTHTNFFEESVQELSYIDMVSGVNYYIKKMKNSPFILIINLDDKEIKSDILDNMIKKFIEISIFASIFLLIVNSIYKRETYLRSSAEQATIVANKATKAKSDFLAFTAHEIRSPLGFISTGSEAMIKKYFGPLPDVYCEYAKGIHDNAQIILDFITDILDENQIIEGKFKVINATANIAELAQNAIQVTESLGIKRRIKIHFIATTEPLPQLICDKRRMLQVMRNILSNAIKYSDENTEINVKIGVSNDKLIIEVVDQGIGMNEEEIEIALSHYGIVLKENYNLIDSIGLGLPIVKMLLEAQEAELLIKSQQGIGTTVKMIFPKHKLVYA